MDVELPVYFRDWIEYSSGSHCAAAKEREELNETTVEVGEEGDAWEESLFDITPGSEARHQESFVKSTVTRKWVNIEARAITKVQCQPPSVRRETL